ncbi:MAG: S41 family peptidase, partial [Cyclobacteriaceae bacterium]
MKYLVIVVLSLLTITGYQAKAQESGKKDSLVYLQPKEEYPIEMQYVLSLLNRYHYRKAPLNDSISAKIFDNYITALDPSRLYFLDSDIAYFQRYKNKIDDDIRKGKLNFAYQLYHVRRERALNRINFLLSSLDNELDFSVNDNYYFDRADAEWAKGKGEWDDLWLKYLKSQAIRYKLQGKEWDEISTSLKKRYNISKKGIYQGKTEDVFESYINAMTRTFDPHTNYFAPKNADDFNIRMSLSLEGIGARLRQNLDYTEIMEVVVGGPAYKSKEVKEKDKIVGVGQKGEEIVDVVGWRIDDVVQLIRGKKGTEVTLLLSRADKSITDDPDTVTIVRDKINLDDEAATGELIPIADNGTVFKLGVITIPKFYRNFQEASAGVKDFKSTTRDVRRLIDSLKQEGMDALMIDLRFNGGGSLQEAVELTGLFIEDGPVVQVKNYDNTVDKLRD